MDTISFTKRHLKAVLGLTVAAFVFAGTAARAGTISYSDITLNNVLLSNIQESNDLAGTVALYGQPVATPDGNSIVFNTAAHPFTSSAANGGSNFLRGVLSFDVQFIPIPTNGAPSLSLLEYGTFTGVGDALATVSPALFVFDSNSNLITSVTGTITPPDPFTGGPNDTKQAFTWSGITSAFDQNQITGYHVVIDNDLTTVSFANGSSAQVDKKLVKLDFCPDCNGDLPEPASLGILGLGAMAMLVRGRRR